MKSFFKSLFKKVSPLTEPSHPASPISMSVVFDDQSFDPYQTSRIPDNELTWTPTICPYCGVGCGLLAGAKDGKTWKIKGDPSHPANKGLFCAKGATLPQMLDTPDRLLSPFLRNSFEEEFSRSSWDEILPFVARKITETVNRYGPDSFAFYISGQLLTEDYYVINKFAKGFLGTNNVDSNSRLCMASAVSGYVTSLGADGPPACYDDIELSHCFFLSGTNTAACHPVTFQRIKMRKMSDPKNVKVIVVDPRENQTADIADLYIPIRPGTDVAFLNGMLHVMEKEGLLDQNFIHDHTEGWTQLQALIADATPEKTATICGLEAADVIQAAKFFGEAKSALSFWSMGLNQSTSGTAKNNAIINLHLATGKIGKPGSGPFSLTGQPNAMGGRETGGLCHLLPGHRFVTDSAHRSEMETLWSAPSGRIASKPGLSAVELFQAVEKGTVKIVWVIATNPIVSLPNAGRVESALKKAELVIVQDPYHPTETTRFAHVLLPAAQWSERDGTVTNSERRISYARKITESPGESRPDWWIVSAVAKEMGFDKAFSYPNAESVFEEYKKTTKDTDMDINGVSYERLRQNPLQWPCPDINSPGTSRLYTDAHFRGSNKKARLHAHSYKAPAELPDKEFPMILTTGRVRDQWHTMTRTGKVDALLKSEPYAFIEIHPADALESNLEDGEMIAVTTRRGRAKAPARVTDRIRKGTCFMPFHWGDLFGDASVNRATIEAFDSISKQPELKFCACRIEKVNERVFV